jgi:hypothetical protein
MIHRVQAPESTSPETPTPTANVPQAASGSNGNATAEGTTATPAAATPALSVWSVIRADLRRHPNLRWIVPAVVVVFLMLSGLVPQATPIFLFALYSFWVPQIWRNARRGNRKALRWRFVLGQSAARLCLPLCESKTAAYRSQTLIPDFFTDAFACPDNVLFLENNSGSKRSGFR